MSDLKKIIQEKYQNEVQPPFNEAAWKSFSEYQAIHHPNNKKKKRRFFWIFLFLLLGMTGSLSFAYLRGSNEIVSEAYRESSLQNSGNSTGILTQTQQLDHNKEIAEQEYQESNFNESENSANILTQPQQLDHNKEIPKQENQESIFNDFENSTAISAQPQRIDPNSVINISSTHTPTANNPLINTSATKNSKQKIVAAAETTQEKATDLSSTYDRSEIETSNHPDKSTRKDLAMNTTQPRIPVEALNKIPVEMNTIETNRNLELSDPVIPLHQLINDGRWMAHVELGTGTMSHRSIRNVEIGIVQTRFQYKLDPHWRIEGMLAFQKNDYISSVQNRSLGLRSVPLPRSTMNLTYVKSSTIYIETGVGIAYEFEPLDRVRISFGPRFRYISEISRNLTYEFADGDNIVEQVYASLDEPNDHPYNIEIHSDLYYEISPKFDIGLSGNYLRPINENEVILPTQWRILVGLRKKF